MFLVPLAVAAYNRACCNDGVADHDPGPILGKSGMISRAVKLFLFVII